MCDARRNAQYCVRPSLAPDITRLVRPSQPIRGQHGDAPTNERPRVGHSKRGEELVIQKMWTVKSSVTTLGTYCGRFHNKPMAMLQCYNELTMRGSSGWRVLYPGLWWIKHYPVTKSKSIGAKRKVKNINVCGSSSNLQLQNISIYEGKQKPYSGSHKWLHKAGRCSTFGNSRLFSEQRMTVCNNDWASAAFIPPQGPLEKCLENLFNFTPIIRRQRQL